MNKDIKLTKVIPIINKETYEEAIKRHLEEITEEHRKSEPELFFIACLTKSGVTYQLLTENDTLAVIGALEIIKNYFAIDNLGD